jgi:hypothetical protein
MPVILIAKGSKLAKLDRMLKRDRRRHPAYRHFGNLQLSDGDYACDDAPLVIHGQLDFFKDPERPGANGIIVSRADCLKHMGKCDHLRIKPMVLTALEIEAIHGVHVECGGDLGPPAQFLNTLPVRIARLRGELVAEVKSLRKKNVLFLTTHQKWEDKHLYFTMKGDCCRLVLRELGAIPQEGE